MKSNPQDGGDDSAEKYRGGRDKDNLVKFINKKLGAEPEEEEEVSLHQILSHCSIVRVLLSSIQSLPLAANQLSILMLHASYRRLTTT